jgi:hypothetical protein
LIKVLHLDLFLFFFIFLLFWLNSLSRSDLNAQSICTSSAFDHLNQQTRHIIIKLVENSARLSDTYGEIKAVRDQLTSLARGLARVDANITNEHRKDRMMFLRYGRCPGYLGPKAVEATVELLGVSQTEEDRVRKKTNMALLEDLSYPSMSHRYEAVLEAYPETFEWAFRGSMSGQVLSNNLSDWLKAGTGVFWIHGKAGSGKSTLMKHLFEDPRTLQKLQAWAEATDSTSPHVEVPPLCVASFFFWNTGSLEQRSQTGLLRCLLHQVLSKFQELIPIAFPEQYARAYSQSMAKESNASAMYFSLRQLMTAFEETIGQSFLPFKLCLLIDGLDEFDGDHEELARLFKLVAQSSNLKICLSSRPWQVFQDGFGSFPNLRLQDLTYLDIYKYIKGKFEQSEAFQMLSKKDITSEFEAFQRLFKKDITSESLVQEIVEKAAGVFLWVRIVVKSLIRGINNHDDIAILHQRLHLLPSELKPLYDHILNNHIEPVYKPWASRAFQILKTSREVLDHDRKLIYSSTDKYLSILQFIFAMDQHLDIEAVSHLDQKSVMSRCEEIAIQLNVRCSGLLEISNESKFRTPERRVAYMHRTVGDFLESNECWSQQLAYTENSAFDSKVALMKSLVLWTAYDCSHDYEHNIYYGPVREQKPSATIKSHITMLSAYYANMHTESQELQIALLDGFDRLRRQHHTLVPEEAFLYLAVRYSLTLYLKAKIQKMEPSVSRDTANSLWNIFALSKKRPQGLPPLRGDVEILLSQYRGNQGGHFGSSKCKFVAEEIPEATAKPEDVEISAVSIQHSRLPQRAKRRSRCDALHVRFLSPE